MCMDEFVKRLYDFMSIYIIFWSQNSHYRYLPIFFQKFQHKRACSTIAIFRWKNWYFSIFRRKIDDFTNFSPIFHLIDFSFAFSSRCRPKTNFSAIYQPKKTIFCSLSMTISPRGTIMQKKGVPEKSTILPIFPRFFI